LYWQKCNAYTLVKNYGNLEGLLENPELKWDYNPQLYGDEFLGYGLPIRWEKWGEGSIIPLCEWSSFKGGVKMTASGVERVQALLVQRTNIRPADFEDLAFLVDCKVEKLANWADSYSLAGFLVGVWIFSSEPIDIYVNGAVSSCYNIWLEYAISEKHTYPSILRCWVSGETLVYTKLLNVIEVNQRSQVHISIKNELEELSKGLTGCIYDRYPCRTQGADLAKCSIRYVLTFVESLNGEAQAKVYYFDLLGEVSHNL